MRYDIFKIKSLHINYNDWYASNMQMINDKKVVF